MAHGRLGLVFFLAAASLPAWGAPSECFYPEAGGEPKAIACPEAAQYADKLPPPPHGLVWRDLGGHQYQPELLLRRKKGKLVPDDPSADPYAASPIEVKPTGEIVKQGFQAPPQAPPPGAAELKAALSALQEDSLQDAVAAATASLDIVKSPQGFLVRATAYNKQGYYKEALADAAAGLALAPNDPALLREQAAADAHIEKRQAAEPPAQAVPLSAQTAAPVTAPELPVRQARVPSRGAPVAFWIGVALLTALLGAGGGFWLALRWAMPPKPPVYVDANLSQPGLTVPRDAAPAQSAPASEAKAGLLKGRFELRSKIGIGGMGVVFDGFDHSLGRRVAIKQMRSELKDFPEERAAFLSEARIISHLSHPYIVGFHDVVEEDGQIYLVFDFVDGKPLSQILWERKRLPLAECQKVFTYVCEAIACAHKNHVLHRDLKPSNIMVDTAGYAKVMDFGIAREAKETITRLTKADTAGTPWYMAPEQHLGKCAKASDIYALGVCLYEALTGKLPFPGPDFLAQKERMKYSPPQFLAPDLPKEVELLFAATFNPDPKKRVADAAELLESLKSLKPPAS